MRGAPAARRLAALAVLTASLAAGPAAGADDLPSPDAVALGQRVVPRALVEGYRDGVLREVLAQPPARPAGDAELPRLRAALAPLLDEAFPPELLAGAAAQVLGRRFDAGELRALRAREETPLLRKLRDFELQAARLSGPDPGAVRRERDALAARTFSAAEQRELEAFGETPLGRKVVAAGPELERHLLDQLDLRWAEVRAALAPRMRRAAEAALSGGAR